ncbi:pyrin-like [Scomber scombrus]|uniref:pyrin-like n=1 Tax=Scomber scombrus TaxID=13677 RepID=UPI002DD992CB|nr:pyrin-like [Scomber scombrus]
MAISQSLLGNLEDLRDDDFEKFKWYLTMNVLDSCRPIPKSRLEKASRPDTVTEIIQIYGEECAVKITVEILMKIYNNNAAETLKQAYAVAVDGGEATPSTSCSALAPPAAPPAQKGMVIINGSVVIHGSVVITKPTEFNSP